MGLNYCLSMHLESNVIKKESLSEIRQACGNILKKTNLNLTHILNVPIIGDQESIFINYKLQRILYVVNVFFNTNEYFIVF